MTTAGEGGRCQARGESRRDDDGGRRGQTPTGQGQERRDDDGTRGGAEWARDESRRGGEQRRKLDEFVHLRRNWFTTKKS